MAVNFETKHFDCTSIMNSLNELDQRNIRTIFKQAKDPVELAFSHIDNQPFKKVATNAIKESVVDVKESIEDLKEAMGTLKYSVSDLFSFVGKILTTNETFTPIQ